MTQSQIHILVVDDERNIRKNLTMVLEASGYLVDAASDGEEAIAKCKERRPDIAFVDVQMPKMGGLEVLSHIRALSRKTAVVMLTAYGTTKRAVDAMKLGAVDFLEKPFDPKAIELLCEEILQRKQFGVTATVDELLHLADLAQERKAHVEARSYLKSAMLRDGTRPEPYYRLGSLSESKGDVRQAKHYYYMSLDAKPSFQPAIDALKRLGGMDSGASKVEIHQ
jgi:DNA-binding response OmpR family regulator